MQAYSHGKRGVCVCPLKLTIIQCLTLFEAHLMKPTQINTCTNKGWERHRVCSIGHPGDAPLMIIVQSVRTLLKGADDQDRSLQCQIFCQQVLLNCRHLLAALVSVTVYPLIVCDLYTRLLFLLQWIKPFDM